MNSLRDMWEELVREEDLPSLDAILTWIFCLEASSVKAPRNHKEILSDLASNLILHNLETKYGLEESECEERMKQVLPPLVINEPDEEPKLRSDELLGIAKPILGENILGRLAKLDDVEKNALAFLLIYLRSIQKRAFSRSVLSSEELKRLTVVFDRAFDEALLAKEKLRGHPLWEIGDVLVKAGIGYWHAWVTGYGNHHLQVMVPTYHFEVVQQHRHLLPEVKDFDEKKLSQELENLDDVEREILSISLRRHPLEPELEEYKLPKVREPECELDLIYLIGRYWRVIKEKTELEDIRFVDKHWDAKGIYRGKEVKIEIKINGEKFDKDPNEIDLLICWKISLIRRILGVLFKQWDKGDRAIFMKWELDDRAKRRMDDLRSRLGIDQLRISLFHGSGKGAYPFKKQLLKTTGSEEEVPDSEEEIAKEILRCVGVEVIELSKLFT